jgi:LmbE family N-acetylglucosaminyl deacetylase
MGLASKQIHNHYDKIYLSPHLDDVALSCGGQVFQRTQAGESVLVATVMAGDPQPGTTSQFADILHKRWSLDNNVTATRRVEDVAACHVMGADYLHLSLPDCIYRQNPESGKFLYTSEQDLFGPVHPTEAPLIGRLTRQFSKLPSTDQVFLPLGVGNHVDHQITRQAAQLGLNTRFTAYYEEYPYSQIENAVTTIVDAEDNWQMGLIPLTEDALSARIEAIACFGSQISTFFTGIEDMAHNVRRYNATVGGERLWYKN